MKLALYQMQSETGNVQNNLDTIRSQARIAADQGAQVIVFPELAVPGYGAAEKMSSLSTSAENDQIEQLQLMADEFTIVIVAGIAEVNVQSLFNSAVCIRPHEKPEIYRKSHLYGGYEKGLFTAADPESLVLSIAGVKIGFLICYDVEFPENVRRLALAGVDVVLVPTALPLSDHAEFIARKLVPVRAFENQVFVAYANLCGSDERFKYFGYSGIFAPSGEGLALATDAPELIFATIDPAAFSKSREENSYLADL
ncbi:carbon-nitrogen hydrolase family protein [Sneathiella glossodoripedis]|uniref:carbon-nitrogen hydrolase family protein n=1 Tax=Sneathiella glossodoripedis TaxID=418853 RepID=UPI00046EB870|nr:carbon-nitrogen hydrolase family protein [Sneathiella glossodoripedis]